MHVHIIFAHPNRGSFTGTLLDAFTRGLGDALHTHTVSDLYEMGFNPVMTPAEYVRESRMDAASPVAPDVAAEQAKLEAADAWVFMYPVWWTDCPAIMKGWFDRVWTVGYAYDPGHNKPDQPHMAAAQHVVEKALILCTAGHSQEELSATGLYQAMKAVMLNDRIGTRAKEREFIVVGGSATDNWQEFRQNQIDRAYDLGRHITG